MADLSLTLFGGFRLVRSAGGDIAISSKRAQAILAYLALNTGQQITRDKLIGVLWQDRSEEQARHSLRQELSVLRKAMGDDSAAILAHGTQLSLDHDLVAVDALRLEELARSGDMATLEEAALLYTGELLEGLNIGSPAFREWCAGERARLADMAYGLMERLAEAREESGEHEAAIEMARRLATMDPLRERAHRLLMRLYNESGRRSDAFRQYQACSKILSRELEVEPEPETRKLFDDIRAQPGAEGIAKTPDADEPVESAETLPLPAKPSIAVLPFDNLSGDIEQEYFADGIAEEIISTLSRFRWCFVIGRNTAFAYKGATRDVKQVARELGVRYVLEGSVRKAGKRVRVSAELSDASTGQHIWAEHYDRELGDVFAMQDEISQAVIASVAPQFLSAEAERARRKDPANFDAWDYCIRARWHLWRFNQEDSAEAKRLSREALGIDPGFAGAWADLASLYVIDVLFGWRRSTPESAAKAREAADKALHYDDQDAWAHAVMGLVDAFSGKKEEGIRRLERALEINPNLASGYGFLAWAANFVGDTERAVREAETAIRLSPRDPLLVFFHAGLAGSAFINGCYDDAAHWARLAVEERSDFPMGYRLLAASLGHMGNKKEAKAAVAEVLRLIPDLTISNLRGQIPYREEDMERFLDGLRKAGLPE